MTHQQFIKAIATAVKKYGSQYDILVCSPIIAQAILESAWGTSTKAKHHNYFGLKYRKGRVSCNNGYFEDGGSEQNSDGTYVQLPTATAWYAFDSLDLGVKGYFEFINTSNYANLKGVTDPLKYLENIKADGYATSLKYVENVYKVITVYGLSKYDENIQEETKMSNSPLVNYTRISPNKTVMSNKVNKKITIHHMAGNLSVETCANVFCGSRQASSNYGVGTDGRIGLYVDEKDRAWTSSSSANDSQAVTIEVANDGGDPNWHVSDKALESTIKLCVDICQRNGIKKLNFTGNATGNLTQHNYFAATDCPGPYLKSKFSYIADEVNKRLGSSGSSETPSTPTTPTTQTMYRVRKSWSDSKSQIGAYKDLSNAKAMVDKNPGYSVFDGSGNVVYSGKASTTFTPYLVKITADVLNVRKGAGTSFAVTTTVKKNGIYTIVGETNGWGKLKSGAGYISLAYTKKV